MGGGPSNSSGRWKYDKKAAESTPYVAVANDIIPPGVPEPRRTGSPTSTNVRTGLLFEAETMPPPPIPSRNEETKVMPPPIPSRDDGGESAAEPAPPTSSPVRRPAGAVATVMASGLASSYAGAGAVDSAAHHQYGGGDDNGAEDQPHGNPYDLKAEAGSTVTASYPFQGEESLQQLSFAVRGDARSVGTADGVGSCCIHLLLLLLFMQLAVNHSLKSDRSVWF